MSGDPALLFRVDASVGGGTGHAMRCLALAQAAHGRRLFAMADAPDAFQSRLDAEGVPLVRVEAAPGSEEDARDTARRAAKEGAEVVVVDGYHFGADFEAELRAAGVRVLAIDDHGSAGRHRANWILDPNLGSGPERYADRPSDTHLLLGPRYAPLRREFEAWREKPRDVAERARRVLVTLGGSDPDDVTSTMVRAIGRLERGDLETIVVVGGSNPHAAAVEQEAQAVPRLSVQLDAPLMPELMDWADVAIAAGGSTCWELCFMGLPALVAVLAPNQTRVASALEEAGAVLGLGDAGALDEAEIARALGALLDDAPRRRALAEAGPRLVDGCGAERVLAALSRGHLSLDRATIEHRRLLFDWANDPGVRNASFSPDPIAWDEHRAWFQGRLLDPDCVQWIARDADDAPIGQVRFDCREREAEIHVSIAPEHRGVGYGADLIRRGIETLARDRVVDVVHAWVRVANGASLLAFESAGFVRAGEQEVRGEKAVHLMCALGGGRA